MQYSANEIEVLLTKAARGIGVPAAQASAFGKAAAIHIARDGDVTDVQAALRDFPAGVILSYPSHLQNLLANGGGVIPCGANDVLRSYALALPFLCRETDTDVTIDMSKFQKVKLPARVTVSANLVDEWRALAAQTFVPETEGSRLGGAGAGLTDND